MAAQTVCRECNYRYWTPNDLECPKCVQRKKLATQITKIENHKMSSDYSVTTQNTTFTNTILPWIPVFF